METARITAALYEQDPISQIIVKADLRRRYLAFCCRLGTCDLYIGDPPPTSPIILPTFYFWEPRIGLINTIRLQGTTGSELIVLYETDIPIL